MHIDLQERHNSNSCIYNNVHSERILIQSANANNGDNNKNEEQNAIYHAEKMKNSFQNWKYEKGAKNPSLFDNTLADWMACLLVGNSTYLLYVLRACMWLFV